MKRIFMLVAMLAMIAVSFDADAKGNLVRIEISGAGLATPLVITDPEVVGKFFMWSGPFAGATPGAPPRNAYVGAFIDWQSGSSSAPEGLVSYDVAFFCEFPREAGARLVYVVKYADDPARRRGYIYLPGPDEPHYRLNVKTVYRG